MLGESIEEVKRRDLAWKMTLREEKKMGSYKAKMTKEEADELVEWLHKTREKYQKYTIEELEEMLRA